MQYFKLLLNNRFLVSTGITGLDFLVFSDYYVHDNNSLGGGIVNPDNVRIFLDDNRTQNIVKEFIAFLSGSTSEPEIVEILGSDVKLSETFNTFYTNMMASGTSNTDVIDNQLTGTTNISYIDNYFNWNGQAYPKALDFIPLEIYNSTRNTQLKSKLISVTLEQSYYIPVNIHRSVQEMDRNIFQLCVDKIIGISNQEIETEIETTERTGFDQGTITINTNEITDVVSSNNRNRQFR